jgi:hypothetical protein
VVQWRYHLLESEKQVLAINIHPQDEVTVGDRFRIYSMYFQKMTNDLIIILDINEHDSTVTAQLIRDGEVLDTLTAIQVQPNWIPCL